MPTLTRPDGVEIAWREQGEGPLVVAMRFGGAPPIQLRDLMGDLVADHRTVDCDLRGTGESSRAGPYEVETDVTDTIAVLEHAGGELPGIAVAVGDGASRAVRIAAGRPDLIDAVLVSGQMPFGPVSGAGDDASDALALSEGVFDGLLQLYETDFRAGFRSVLTTADPNVGEDEIRRRVDAAAAYCSPEAMVGRLRSWRTHDARAHARELGERLWIQAYAGNAWFPIELLEVIRSELPEARIERVEDGAISRPDLAAKAVRELTGAAARDD